MAYLSARHGVHPEMIAQWKATAQKGMLQVFSSGRAREEKSHEEEVKDLEAKMGQLTVECNYLSKALGAEPRPKGRHARPGPEAVNSMVMPVALHQLLEYNYKTKEESPFNQGLMRIFNHELR